MIHARDRYSYRPPATAYRPLILAPPAVAVLDVPRRDYSVSEAAAFCVRLARARDEAVPLTSHLLPAEVRPHVLSVYAFARAANDFADEAFYAGSRETALDTWEHELCRAFHDEADHPIFVALRDTIDRCDLPITPFQDLLTAFRMDLFVDRYATFADLRRYCQYSSGPLGKLMLYLFGHRDQALHDYAEDLCAGLQLVNFLQDLGLDYNGHRGRLYLPQEDLRHFGVSEQDLRRCAVTPAFRDLMRFQVARAQALLTRGRPLIDRIGRIGRGGELGFELELTWHSGQAILAKIEAVGYDVFRRRPVLSSADRARLLAFAIARRFMPWD